MAKLAINGGSPILSEHPEKMFHWPIVNDAMIDAQKQILLDGNMSGTDISKKFEAEFAAWNGRKYALAHCNGTSALMAAMYGIGMGPGDEIICPAITYWASCTSALLLGSTVVFCDIREKDLQIDPVSVEERITPRTRAIMVVHYLSHPADMDAIMAIARKHHLKVIEDVSHAHGGLYKGRKLGTFGDAAAMSMMSGKAFAIGEGGMLITDDHEIYRRAVRFGHYDRISSCYSPEEIAGTRAIPVGGQKFRMHQMSAAIGLEQLKKYDSEIAEIDRAMKYFWNGIKDIPGFKIIHPEDPGSTKAGWYSSRFHYDPEVFSGVDNLLFSHALNAEVSGSPFNACCNFPLHKSELYFTEDILGHGKPTASVYLPAGVDPRKLTGELPVACKMNSRLLAEPWFKHYDPVLIDRYIEAVHKVVEHHQELIPLSRDKTENSGNLALTARKQ